MPGSSLAVRAGTAASSRAAAVREWLEGGLMGSSPEGGEGGIYCPAPRIASQRLSRPLNRGRTVGSERRRPKTSTSEAVMQAFANRVVLITGAGSGIGRRLAHVLSEQGARIAALDLDAASLA